MKQSEIRMITFDVVLMVNVIRLTVTVLPDPPACLPHMVQSSLSNEYK
jgi:hypothetical protein